MKTEEGNTLSDFILKKVKELNEIANYNAVNYAKTDKPEYKLLFDKYTFAAEEVRSLHATVCQAIHLIENKIG